MGQVTSTFAITSDIRAIAEDVLRTHQEEYEEYLGSAAARRLQLERSLRQHESDRRRLALEFARGRIAEEVYTDLETQLRKAIKLVEGEVIDVGDAAIPDINAALEYVT